MTSCVPHVVSQVSAFSPKLEAEGLNSIRLTKALKPRLRVRSYAEALARGQLAELYFWKFIKVFPYQSSFTVISLVDASEGSFPFRSRLRRSFEVLLIG